MLVTSGILPPATLVHPCTSQGRAQAKGSAGAAIAQAHSDRLCGLIRDEIKAGGGQITFARYMALALYAPGLGYYSAGSHKLGQAGDFVTAPELSPLFSRCVARQCQQVLKHLAGGDILEVGAGSGAWRITSSFMGYLNVGRIGCMTQA